MQKLTLSPQDKPQSHPFTSGDTQAKHQNAECRKWSGRAPINVHAGTPRLFNSASMARPKVHPDNRLRANTACTACRKSKKRCSGQFPCSNCLHKGLGGSCIPFRSLPARSRPAASRPAAPRWSEPEIGLQSPLRSQTHEVVTPNQRVTTPEAESHSPEAPHRTHPRMLRNRQGDRGMWL